MAEYGKKIVYQKNQKIQFQDFSIQFLGVRHIKIPQFKPGFTCYDFEIFPIKEPAKGFWPLFTKKTIKVSWSSGTGVIVPEPFEVNGKQYALELFFSKKLGQLKENELVIEKKE